MSKSTKLTEKWPLIYIEFIEINKHKKKLQIYIQQLMAAHIIVDNGYLKIE